MPGSFIEVGNTCTLQFYMGKGLTVVVTDDMCLECCEGAHNDEWIIGKPLTFFWEFREWLSEQMLQHETAERAYPGDGHMRVAMGQSSRQGQVPSTCRRPGCPKSVNIPY